MPILTILCWNPFIYIEEGVIILTFRESICISNEYVLKKMFFFLLCIMEFWKPWQLIVKCLMKNKWFTTVRKRQRLDALKSLTLNNDTVRFTQDAKFLGIVLDSKLS